MSAYPQAPHVYLPSNPGGQPGAEPSFRLGSYQPPVAPVRGGGDTGSCVWAQDGVTGCSSAGQTGVIPLLCCPGFQRGGSATASTEPDRQTERQPQGGPHRDEQLPRQPAAEGARCAGGGGRQRPFDAFNRIIPTELSMVPGGGERRCRGEAAASCRAWCVLTPAATAGGPPAPPGWLQLPPALLQGAEGTPTARPRPHAAAARARLATSLAGLRSCRQSPQPGDGASRWGARGGASECLRPSWAQMAAGPGQLRLGGTLRSVAPATAGAAGSNAGQAGPGATPALGCSCRFPPPPPPGTAPAVPTVLPALLSPTSRLFFPFPEGVQPGRAAGGAALPALQSSQRTDPRKAAGAGRGDGASPAGRGRAAAGLPHRGGSLQGPVPAARNVSTAPSPQRALRPRREPPDPSVGSTGCSPPPPQSGRHSQYVGPAAPLGTEKRGRQPQNCLSRRVLVFGF